MLWSTAVRAVGEPTRQSVVDASFMQVDEPRYLGSTLPEGTVLTDAAGQDFRIGDLRGKPLILLLSYYGCDGTCPVMNAELAKVLAKVDRFRLGDDYRVLTVSFDRKDTPATAADFLAKTDAVPASMRQGWRHAVLKQPDTQEAFAGGVGFRFFWSDAAEAFLHPNVLVFLTPQGRVARYIYGTGMDARNIELAILDADWERISNSSAVFDIMTGACFSYNYVEGRYQWNYSLLAGVGSLLSGITLMILGTWFYRKRMGRANA